MHVMESLVDATQVLTVRDGGFAEGVEEGQGESDKVQRAVLNYVDQVTIANRVDDTAWEALQLEFAKNGWLEQKDPI